MTRKKAGNHGPKKHAISGFTKATMFAILVGTMMPAAGSVRGPACGTHALPPILSARRRGAGRWGAGAGRRRGAGRWGAGAGLRLRPSGVKSGVSASSESRLRARARGGRREAGRYAAPPVSRGRGSSTLCGLVPLPRRRELWGRQRRGQLLSRPIDELRVCCVCASCVFRACRRGAAPIRSRGRRRPQLRLWRQRVLAWHRLVLHLWPVR
jgi:hypothetical protein